MHILISQWLVKLFELREVIADNCRQLLLKQFLLLHNIQKLLSRSTGSSKTFPFLFRRCTKVNSEDKSVFCLHNVSFQSKHLHLCFYNGIREYVYMKHLKVVCLWKVEHGTESFVLIFSIWMCVFMEKDNCS